VVDGRAFSASRGTVLVAGGGIGGLQAALGLGRCGFDVTVLERSAEFGEIGAGLQLAPNATRVLKKLRLLDQVLDVGVLPQRLVLADAVTGEELTALDVTDFDKRYGGPYVVVHRADLLSILLEACRAEPSIELVPGKAITRVEEPDPRTVLVSCADGSTFSGDVLLGADGLHSRVRKLIDDSPPVASGYVAYRGAVPTELVPDRSADRDVVAFLGVGLHFVQYPLRGGRLYNQVAVFQSRRFLAGADDWGGPEELDEAFSGAHERIRNALGAIDRQARWQMYDREPLTTWTHGRSVLLGDAAHPMLQYLAQGACQAIEDGDCLAYALGQARAQGGDLVQGFTEYERHRLARAGRTQRHARIWGDMWHADGVARVLMNAYLRERDPRDHRHVSPLYGTPPTCAHSTSGPAGESYPAHPIHDDVAASALATSPTQN
jgi:2-polyprenyl-6-methoxyphenol hydroxylase-like FAD-dependent oxidoreductase